MGEGSWGGKGGGSGGFDFEYERGVDVSLNENGGLWSGLGEQPAPTIYSVYAYVVILFFFFLPNSDPIKGTAMISTIRIEKRKSKNNVLFTYAVLTPLLF